MQKRKSLANKLTILLCAIITVIFLIITLIVYNITRGSMEKQIDESIKKNSEIGVGEIEVIFDKTNIIVEQLATDRNIRSFLKEVNKWEDIKNHRFFDKVTDTMLDIKDFEKFIQLVWITNDRANFLVDNTDHITDPEYD